MVVRGCFLVAIGCLGGKKAVRDGIWQVWGVLGSFGVFPRTLLLRTRIHMTKILSLFIAA